MANKLWLSRMVMVVCLKQLATVRERLWWHMNKKANVMRHKPPSTTTTCSLWRGNDFLYGQHGREPLGHWAVHRCDWTSNVSNIWAVIRRHIANQPTLNLKSPRFVIFLWWSVARQHLCFRSTFCCCCSHSLTLFAPLKRRYLCWLTLILCRHETSPGSWREFSSPKLEFEEFNIRKCFRGYSPWALSVLC